LETVIGAVCPWSDVSSHVEKAAGNDEWSQDDVVVARSHEIVHDYENVALDLDYFVDDRVYQHST